MDCTVTGSLVTRRKSQSEDGSHAVAPTNNPKGHQRPRSEPTFTSNCFLFTENKEKMFSPHIHILMLPAGLVFEFSGLGNYVKTSK